MSQKKMAQSSLASNLPSLRAHLGEYDNSTELSLMFILDAESEFEWILFVFFF